MFPNDEAQTSTNDFQKSMKTWKRPNLSKILKLDPEDHHWSKRQRRVLRTILWIPKAFCMIIVFKHSIFSQKLPIVADQFDLRSSRFCITLLAKVLLLFCSTNHDNCGQIFNSLGKMSIVATLSGCRSSRFRITLLAEILFCSTSHIISDI